MQLETSKIKDAFVATALALMILYVVGFAPGIYHNAAHDLRHAFAVPCH